MMVKVSFYTQVPQMGLAIVEWVVDKAEAMFGGHFSVLRFLHSARCATLATCSAGLLAIEERGGLFK